jgi:hypothetical protein
MAAVTRIHFTTRARAPWDTITLAPVRPRALVHRPAESSGPFSAGATSVGESRVAQHVEA